MKKTLLHLLWRTNSFAPFRRAHQAQALIMVYHRFSPIDEGYKTSAQQFAAQIRYLQKYYRVVSLSEIVNAIRSGASLAKLAAITIDDGHHDAYEIAYPILRHYDVPATLFLVTDFLDGKKWMWTDKTRYLAFQSRQASAEVKIGGRTMQFQLNGKTSRYETAARLNAVLKALPETVKEKELARIAEAFQVHVPPRPANEFRPLTWEQAREMAAHKITIGSHTVTHPILTNINDEQLAYELKKSRCRLTEMIGREVDLFCYPNGTYDERVKAAVTSAGYRSAVITKHGFVDQHDDLFTLHRFHDEPDLAHFAQTISGIEEVKKQLRTAIGWP